MSGLEVAAAIVGVTDVAIRSILISYDLLKDLQEAPEAVARLRQETSAVAQSLQSLESLKTANGNVQELVKQVGLAEAVNQCGASCDGLNKNLAKWTSSGDGLVSKLQMVRHKSQVEKCCQQIRTAKGTVVLSVSVASLAMLAASSSAADDKKRQQVGQLEQEISRLQVQVQGERDAAAQTALALQKRIECDEDDLDAQVAINESKQQLEACDQLWANCLVAEDELHTLAKVDVTVGHMLADTQSQNYAGVPKDVLKKVAQAKVKVGNMKASNGSVNRVGIF
ncbi:hypothetical protein D0869_01952 [Hortaea werneckii]|uniref:Azaphilone pigments biosynthesis cluster protein L N-terminal domain-containing protein n=1 Tax=Hortaea werneckii TaxID=91943 RepID=A0A3M6Z9K2_HORWE|nr:hypothetical protein KC324_g944 [Hortaea werneckii]KAI7594851.1 hypothetical protein KC316_g902 [Hortaea werneckii]RMX87998.1 hypothetical protein D0869_01952 [Hortaea werneckii]RMY11953.1 hypothetical protein D0868_02852 [Hortaea werneckii]